MNIIVFDACALPEGFQKPDSFNSVNPSQGFTVRYPRLVASDHGTLVSILTDANSEIRRMPVSEIIQAIGNVSNRFMDQNDSLRKEALEIMVPTAGISSEMAEVVLAGMAKNWTAKRLTDLLNREFAKPEILDGFQRLDSGRKQMAYGLDVNFTLGSGTVPGVGVTAMIRGLLMKSSVLLKPGLGDVALPVLFARALGEEHKVFRGCLGVVYWDGMKDRMDSQMLEKVGVVVAYGSDETINAIRSRVPVTANFVAYRHRLGVGLVTREALSHESATDTARSVATSISTFDQKGCVSPQVVYVERGGKVTPEEWVELLGTAMEKVEDNLPSGLATTEEAIGTQQLHAATELSQGRGSGALMLKGRSGSWTVVFDPELALKWSNCRRVVYVKPISDLDKTRKILSRSASYLQTVAVEGTENRKEAIASFLSQIGVTRVTSFKQAPWPEPWWHQDGNSVFQGLYKLIDLEDSKLR